MNKTLYQLIQLNVNLLHFGRNFGYDLRLMGENMERKQQSKCLGFYVADICSLKITSVTD